jgi:hypothetical protein
LFRLAALGSSSVAWLDAPPACSVRTGWQAGAAGHSSGNAARMLGYALARRKKSIDFIRYVMDRDWHWD